MDKDNLNQKPISTLTTAELAQLSGSSPNSPAPAKKPKQQPLVIILAVALAVVTITATIIIIKLNQRPSETSDTTSSVVEPEYVPPEEDETISATQYLAEQQAIVDSTEASTTEKLDAIVSMANLDAAFGRIEEAEARLNAVNKNDLDELQLFDLYASYAYVYDCAGDSAKVEEYNQLADEALAIYWAHQELAPPEESE